MPGWPSRSRRAGPCTNCGTASPRAPTASAATCVPMQTLRGHSSVAITERYTAVDDEMRAAMMAALSD
jgi:hypothetical protein